MSSVFMILLSTVKKSFNLNLEINMQRSRTIYNQKQSKTALNKCVDMVYFDVRGLQEMELFNDRLLARKNS